MQLMPAGICVFEGTVCVAPTAMQGGVITCVRTLQRILFIS